MKYMGALIIAICLLLVIGVGRHHHVKTNTAWQKMAMAYEKEIERLTGHKPAYLPDSDTVIVHEPQHDNEAEETLLAAWVYLHSHRCSIFEARKIVRVVFAGTSIQNKLLLLALMATESNFDAHAVSKSGAIGLGQIMPVWVPELIQHEIIQRKRDLFDFEFNIHATDYVFGKMLGKAKGDAKRALGFYFGAKNRAYINKVMSNLGELCVLEKRIERG